MKLESENFTHTQDITTSNIEILSYQDSEDNILEGKYFYEEEEESFDSYEDFKMYLYFKDEHDSNHPDQLRNNTSEQNGTVILRAPTKFSWGVILGAVTIAFNIVVSGTAVYFYQANLNTSFSKDIADLEFKLERLDQNKYNKTEDDLVRENIKLELQKQNEILTKLEQRSQFAHK